MSSRVSVWARVFGPLINVFKSKRPASFVAGGDAISCETSEVAENCDVISDAPVISPIAIDDLVPRDIVSAFGVIPRDIASAFAGMPRDIASAFAVTPRDIASAFAGGEADTAQTDVEPASVEIVDTWHSESRSERILTTRLAAIQSKNIPKARTKNRRPARRSTDVRPAPVKRATQPRRAKTIHAGVTWAAYVGRTASISRQSTCAVAQASNVIPLTNKVARTTRRATPGSSVGRTMARAA